MDQKNKILNEITLITCSGSEYHGELARQVAINLSEKSYISSLSSIFCSTIFMKNVILKKNKLIEITKKNLESNFIIIIDGCKTSCESLVFKKIGINPELIIHIDDFVPKKKLNLNDLDTFRNKLSLSNVNEEEVLRISNAILKKLKDKKLID